MKLRFTIRDLLFVTVIIAIAIGWGLDHRSQQMRLDTEVGQAKSDVNRLMNALAQEHRLQQVQSRAQAQQVKLFMRDLQKSADDRVDAVLQQSLTQSEHSGPVKMRVVPPLFIKPHEKED